ncbi:MAG: hypothetical protein WBS54_12230 [Acidobacteriota bacterium]
MTKTLRGVILLVGGLACAGLGQPPAAQTPPSAPVTYWICRGPTIPHYTGLCASHPRVTLDRVWFTTGCYDVESGLPVNCTEQWQEYFSADGVDPAAMDYWTGGHNHSRYNGDTLHNIGGLWLDTLPGPDQPVLDSGEWQTDGRTDAGFVAIPEPSGVDLVFIRFRAPAGWWCVENASWVRDTSDPSCRTCQGSFTVEAHVEGLELLPDSPVYTKSSNPGQHTADVFYGTPEMNQKLAALAQQYRDWYHQEHGAWIKISINDMSLPYGGLYDYTGNWDCPHKLHRLGRSADVNRASYVYKDELDRIALRRDGLIEDHRTGTLMHYELP